MQFELSLAQASAGLPEASDFLSAPAATLPGSSDELGVSGRLRFENGLISATKIIGKEDKEDDEAPAAMFDIALELYKACRAIVIEHM